MAKGYWLASVDVKNPDGYKLYVAALPPIFKKYGARYVTRGGRAETVEGKSRSRVVVIEFNSYDDAMACYRSPEYQQAIALRKAAADADLSILEGYDGAQP